jgi:uncharacterized membrane protein
MEVMIKDNRKIKRNSRVVRVEGALKKIVEMKMRIREIRNMTAVGIVMVMVMDMDMGKKILVLKKIPVQIISGRIMMKRNSNQLELKIKEKNNRKLKYNKVNIKNKINKQLKNNEGVLDFDYIQTFAIHYYNVDFISEI